RQSASAARAGAHAGQRLRLDRRRDPGARPRAARQLPCDGGIVNGLLHRVAARVAGTAAVVRSDAGLPYAGGGFALEEAGETRDNLPGPVAARSQVPASVLHERQPSTRPADHDAPPPLVAAAGVVGQALRAATTADYAHRAPGADSTRPSAFDEPPATMPPSYPAPLMARTAPTPN